MSQLKTKLSKVLGYSIENLGWDETFKRAAISGKLSSKLDEILLEICKELDPFIPDMIAKPTSVNERVAVFNPLSKDFSISFDIAGTGAPESFTARSKELTYFSPVVSTQMKKKLIQEIIQERNVPFNEIEIRKVDAEVSATLT